jgi:hypothetical protein
VIIFANCSYRKKATYLMPHNPELRVKSGFQFRNRTLRRARLSGRLKSRLKNQKILAGCPFGVDLYRRRPFARWQLDGLAKVDLYRPLAIFSRKFAAGFENVFLLSRFVLKVPAPHLSENAWQYV